MISFDYIFQQDLNMAVPPYIDTLAYHILHNNKMYGVSTLRSHYQKIMEKYIQMKLYC